ncbi:non-ribosomal peptide synthetase [Streptomyces malaysiensis]|uniref:Non-ribosomal peptide synthetase n=1 Tax=Streptomyces malaysiensis TaxID=92644 RepID=A0A7X6AWD8_STRMQ|nr:non-ribosomal peptide synthetase [Streptomyces malaysiensis]NIY63832.1 non-ribosomal peptide synthetase [Streptomyces malaysiensis]
MADEARVTPPPPPRTVLEFFDDTRRASPELPAVEHRGRRLSYEELGRAADTLAARLHGPSAAGTVVGIRTDRSFRLPIAILAALRAGAAYLPLDHTYPKARLDFMMRDSGMRVLLTHRTRTGLPAVPSGTRIVLLDDDVPTAPVRQQLPISTATADDLAYVIYTSGSTGTPKGVAMPHGPLRNLITWQREAFTCGVGSRTLQFAAASFDVHFEEMFSTWGTGGCLVLIDEEIRRDSHRLLRFLDERQVHRVFMPFVALQALAHTAQDLGRHPRALREVVCGGEQLYITPAVRQFFGALPDVALHNQYGPSETHNVTALRLPGDPASWPERAPIGRPINAARVRVLDGHGRPVPAGATGEIVIGGPVLARGYLNRPGLSAERFTPDPLGPPGSRVYRTGDLGRVDERGRIHFLGREDGQVKIRGYRVELGEVESAVRALPEVADAAVVVNEGRTAGKRLVAYVVGEAPLPGDLRARLAETLPEYMLPVAFVPVDRLPLTPSGKLDRRSLAERELTVSGSGARPAEDGVQRDLTQLWEHVLDAKDIAADDNFFQLGGTSLLAAVLMTRIAERFGAYPDLGTFIARPTLSAMAEWIRERPEAGTGQGAVR